VGFIDIMGFKDMVARNEHEDVYTMMKNLRSVLNFAEDVFGISPAEDSEDKFVTMTTYSDSIMVYSKDDSRESFDLFITAIACLHEDLFLENIPHKGAVAFGKMTLDIDNSIFFGQPLIDAYLLQEELNFYSIVCHASAEKEILNHGDISGTYLFEYLCYFKTGRSNHFTIYPMSLGIKKPGLEDKVKKLKMITSGSLRKYIDNTLDYLSSVRILINSN
jgi:hypothetical protein